MIQHVFYLAPVLLVLPLSVAAQELPAAPPAERSHVERFSSPEARAGKAEEEASAKLASNPKDADAMNARALARVKLGRYREAYEDLQRAVALKPDNSDYQADFGYVLWKLGRPTEAIAAERKSLSLDEKNFTAHYQLGRFLLRAGGLDGLKESSSQLKRAVELDPRQVDVRFELLAAYRAAGDSSQANAQLQLLQDARPSDPRVTYISGLLSSDRGDLSAAIDSFRQAVQQDPTLYGAWQDLGVAYIKQERWAEAAATFADLDRRQPGSAETAYFHALSLYNLGHLADAEREIRRALQIDEGSALAHTLLGIILFDRGGADPESRDWLTQAVVQDPRGFDAQYYLGRVEGEMKDYAAAAENFRQAIKLNPGHPMARFLLGQALENLSDSDAAMAEYQQLVNIDPNSAYGKLGLGVLLMRHNRIDEAITALTRANQINPKIFEAQWSLGRALALAHRDQEAIQAFRAANALSPDRPDGHYQLALTLKRTGQTEEAAREFAIVNRITTTFRNGAVQ